jgi:glycosyltransferase involved in cell wall biosynthesis
MDRITAIIITQNEERNIGRCLVSLRGVADEVVVVDSGSTDATERICREQGVVFQHHDWAGYS